MKPRVHAVLLLLCFAGAHSLHAQANQDSALSMQGFTGVLNTPNAHAQREGTFDALYSNQRELIKGEVPRWEDSYLFSVGMFKFAEFGGRLTNTPSTTNDYPFGIRDLSVNVKLSTDPVTSHFRFSPALAVGIQDAGGGHHFFQTTYLAGSADPLGWLRVSAGYGKGPDRMKGAFGGVELRAHPWVTLLGDYDTLNTNLGARVTTPTLPYVLARLTATFSKPIQNSQGLAISGGLIIPLDFKKESSHHDAISATSQRNAPAQTTLWGTITAKKRVTAPGPSPLPAPLPAGVPSQPVLYKVPIQAPSGPPAVTSTPSKDIDSFSEVDPWAVVDRDSLEIVRERLIKAGFVNVQIGLQGKALVVVYENIRFNHNELDAIGVVTGIASQAAGRGVEDLRLVIRRKGLAVLQIEAPILPLHDWLEASTAIQAPALTVSQKLTSEDGTYWIGGDDNSGRFKPSLIVYPNLTTFVGTEYGLFDYQLSIRPELQLPLWAGATAVARWDLPVARSTNLKNGGVYASYSTPVQTDRLMVFQALRLAPGLMANLGGGKILGATNGTLNELSWTPGDGMNRVKVIQAWGRGGDTNRNVILGSYRLLLARHELAFEGTAGRFFEQDTGFSVNMQRFFGDTAVSLYFKDSVTPTDQRRWLQAGIQLEFPLTPRRDMKAKLIQIRGHEDWGYAQETGVASSTVEYTNYVQPGLALIPIPTENLGTFFYDRERLNSSYILSHKERIRESWRFFRDHL